MGKKVRVGEGEETIFLNKKEGPPGEEITGNF